MSNYIPRRFELEVLSHILGVFSNKSEQLPLILGIFGMPGNGKTFMCEEILVQKHIKIFPMSVGEFENESSGVPAEKLREKYNEVVKYCIPNNTYAVLLINDVDTAIGVWGDMHQYTVNLQHVLGELMQLADPHLNQKRIPVIFTGNDFTKLYQPLVRSGRLAPLNWEPNPEEMFSIIKGIFENLYDGDIRKLIDELAVYGNEKQVSFSSVAFYASLKRYFYQDYISELLNNKYPFANIINFLKSYDVSTAMTLHKLVDFGKREIDKIEQMNKKHLK